MPDIKIFLGPGETPQSASDVLLKAMLAKKGSGKPLGAGEDFGDPAMDAVADHLFKAHATMFDGMLVEIGAVLEAEIARGGA